MDVDEKNKQAKNLFRSLQNNPQSIFYATNKVTKNLLKKARTATNNKDKVFVNLYDQLEDKDFIKDNLPFVTPYVQNRSDTDRSTLYRFIANCLKLFRWILQI